MVSGHAAGGRRAGHRAAEPAVSAQKAEQHAEEQCRRDHEHIGWGILRGVPQHVVLRYSQ
jgi:hypothetical protein